MNKVVEKSQVISWTLAKKVEAALIEEVSLTPKPGLVDRLNNGSHEDMNYQLFIKSARALTPYFYEMAQAAWGKPVNQELREAIAQIGRQAEEAMYQATDQVNTHKGAIWSLGLLVSVSASQMSLQGFVDTRTIFDEVAKLAAYPDRTYQKAPVSRESKVTHGQKVKQQFGVSGAYGEAVAGYPHVQLALDEYERHTDETTQMRNLHMLLAIIGSLDDTCILYRSNQETLTHVHQLAKEANQTALPNQAFLALIAYCEEKQISPGGSADLLAASLYVQGMKEQDGLL
ncbi:triphosphoribosyl-dephospho-CoA synthase [Enterococcus sp. JM4C]|uniref:triphosphoribosyl-dephospho-CoA synthase MdcB n=1 Tax=Candidatus Enterococcus huntleyi TaxID=1857217 RepID=UPI00137B5538|nr:triphosphoribosyl-dephospho-CoA synthase MdcB [Enterococcus sp. JM4C]KAF1297810.1 triphosphoribosyl-dephospho-CoA synthase [Enterococcus sp. JM4C]